MMKSAVRLLSSAGKAADKVHVLLLHETYPRNEFYARKVLSKEAKTFYNLPRNMNLSIPSALIPDKIARCMEEYGKHGDIQDTVLNPLSREVERAVIRLMPELSSFSISCASPYESPTIEETVKKAFDAGINHLIIMPLQPQFSCSKTGFLINETVRCIESLTVSNERNERVVLYSPSATKVSIIDRWNTHPVMSSLWSTRLEELHNDVDGVIFAAPILRGYGRCDYERSVHASAERVIAEARVALPWKLAFYNSWNQWDVPVCEGFRGAAKAKLFKEKSIVVVPITTVIPTLDTMSILPRIVVTSDKMQLLQPVTDDGVLVHGLSEIIKNYLLGRRSVQYKHTCKGCWRGDCKKTRDILQ